MTDFRRLGGRLNFSLRAIFLLFIAAAILAWLTTWLLLPVRLDVRVEIEPYSLPRYDDHAGNLPLGAAVQITNMSESTIWVLGLPGSATHVVQQLVNGNWEASMSSVTVDPATAPLSNEWMPLRSMESITILAGPISEKASEMRVGLPFTAKRFATTEVCWVFSPIVKIVKRGQDYFPEATPDAQQEEQVLSLTWPSTLSPPIRAAPTHDGIGERGKEKVPKD